MVEGPWDGVEALLEQVIEITVIPEGSDGF